MKDATQSALKDARSSVQGTGVLSDAKVVHVEKA